MEVGPFAEPMEAECSAAVVQEEREVGQCAVGKIVEHFIYCMRQQFDKVRKSRHLNPAFQNPVASPLSTVSLEHIMEQDEHFQIERYLGIDQFSPGKWAELHVLEVWLDG